jgi:large subunit ribosomal protein L13
VVTNSDKLVVTGNKMTDKMYYRHSQYPGSLKEATLAEKMQKDSTDVIVLAVKGMLPKNKLMAERLNRLKVYSGEEHKHEAQKPVKVSVK